MKTPDRNTTTASPTRTMIDACGTRLSTEWNAVQNVASRYQQNSSETRIRPESRPMPLGGLSPDVSSGRVS